MKASYSIIVITENLVLDQDNMTKVILITCSLRGEEVTSKSPLKVNELSLPVNFAVFSSTMFFLLRKWKYQVMRTS